MALVDPWTTLLGWDSGTSGQQASDRVNAVVDAVNALGTSVAYVESLAADGEDPLQGIVRLAAGDGIALTQDDGDRLITIAAAGINEVTRLDPEWPCMAWYGLEGSPGSPYHMEAGELEVGYAGAGGRTYYEWLAPGATQVEVSGALKWRLPARFAGWDDDAPITLAIWTTDTGGDASIDFTVYRGTLQLTSKLANASSGGWAYVTFTSLEIGGGGWAAGDVMTLEVTMRAKADGTAKVARLGELELRWTASR